MPADLVHLPACQHSCARVFPQVWLFPRRKLGEGSNSSTEKGRPPLKVGIESIEPLYGLPQKEAAKALGISLTALKQVCRKLGIHRWPYWRKKKSRSSAGSGDGSSRVGGEGSSGEGSSSNRLLRVVPSAVPEGEPSSCTSGPLSPYELACSSSEVARVVREGMSPGAEGGAESAAAANYNIAKMSDMRESEAAAALVAVSAGPPRHLPAAAAGERARSII